MIAGTLIWPALAPLGPGAILTGSQKHRERTATAAHYRFFPTV